MISAISNLHDKVFAGINKAFGGWLPGLLARVIWASALMLYFWNSGKTKLCSRNRETRELECNILEPRDAAYYQIVPGYTGDDPGFIGHAMVYAGTYAEFILPLLILIGLFTRLASAGMLVFLAVMTYVDIAVHQIDAQTIGSFFNRISTELIADQRLLWTFPLIYLVFHGAGAISVDGILGRARRRE